MMPAGLSFGFPARDVSALLLCAALLACLCSLLLGGLQQPSQAQQDLTLRRVKIATPPPPPPPAPPQRQQNESLAKIALEKSTVRSQLVIARTQKSSTRNALSAPETHFELAQINWEQDLAIDWDAFAPESLDSAPRILTLAPVTWPRDLGRKNIDRALVKLDVMIDESGTPILIDIKHNPYPLLDSAIKQIVRGSRFTKPTRDGKAVRARFIWPLELRK